MSVSQRDRVVSDVAKLIGFGKKSARIMSSLPLKLTGSASSLAMRQYVKSAQVYGFDVHPMMVSNGIDERRLDDIHYRTELWRFEALIADMLDQSNDPLFGLRTAQQVELGTYNVLGYISNHVQSLREMCDLIPTYEQIFGDIGTTQLIVGSKRSFLRWKSQLWDPRVSCQVAENTLGSWYRFVKMIIGVPVTPLGVSFTHAAPVDAATRQALEDHFDCDVRFSDEHNGIWIDTAKLDQPNPNPDPTLLKPLLAFADDLLAQINRDLTTADRVRRALRLGKNAGRVGIARDLGLSGRSLHRRLEQEGTGFQILLDEVRFEAAVRDLRHSDLPVSQIAADLGYAEVRSFYRRFKAWSGLTVGQFRAASEKNGLRG